ncbi:hypothetical protein DFQ30_001850 [Apophysomyces sp. BC1015]|nr:hypothetical protein DFQ30_001850 [Apophysomyces sp. BC1015]
MSLNCIADKLLGQYGTQNIPLQWTHKMKKRKRKRERWRVKAFEQEDMRPAIVAFGDADLRPMPGQAPLPIKDFRRILSHKALVVCIDEFRTSKVCSYCDRDTVELIRLTFIQSMLNRKKYLRLGTENRRRQRCMREDNSVLCYSSQCTQAREYGPQSWKSILYPVRMCPHCLSDTNEQHQLIWNRDVNTGKNMRRILREYIQSGCRIDSRPPALQRPARPPQTTQEQLVTGG